jgi:hypothetical protein
MKGSILRSIQSWWLTGSYPFGFISHGARGSSGDYFSGHVDCFRVCLEFYRQYHPVVRACGLLKMQVIHNILWKDRYAGP